MQKDQTQRYAESLERTVQNDHRFLKEAVPDFREMCLLITPGKSIPQGMINDIREIYKEILTRLTEVKAVQQLLMGKYHQYARRDPMRDKEMKELAFVAKNCYTKFDYILMQRQALEKARVAEKERDLKISPSKELPYRWFRLKDNQVLLMRNLRILNELDYESPSALGIEERREVTQDRPRSLTLYVVLGDEKILDNLQFNLGHREHDAVERYGKQELRGVITHLKEISALEVENVFRSFMARGEPTRLKCLFITIQPQKHLEGDLLGSVEKALQEMAEGEVRELPI